MSEQCEQWNNSDLTMLLHCGERYRRRRIESEVVPSTLPQTRGTIVHRVTGEANRRQWASIATKGVPLAVPMPGEEAADMVATLFDEQVEFTLTAEERANLGAARGATKDAAVGMARTYVVKHAPTLYPVAVEEKIIIQPAGTDILVHGTPDLVCLERDDSTIYPPGEAPIVRVIRDTKTAMKAPATGVAHASQQLTFYGMLDAARTGQGLPAKYKLDFTVHTPKWHTSTITTLSTTRTPADVAALAHRLNTAIAAVRAGVFLPAAPGSWHCSAKWCEFHSSCKFVNHTEA